MFQETDRIQTVYLFSQNELALQNKNTYSNKIKQNVSEKIIYSIKDNEYKNQKNCKTIQRKKLKVILKNQ